MKRSYPGIRSEMEQHCHAPKPKRRILSVDGGGVRGIIAIEVLARLEALLRERAGNSSLVLSDVFDFVAGTSAGAVIVTSLALGQSVENGRQFFFDNIRDIFRPQWHTWSHWRYGADALSQHLQVLYGAKTTLGSDAFRTLLMLVLRNATTDSPWFVTNNPFALYNDRSIDDCNLDIEIWRLVRASAAAPSFFPPKVLQIGADTRKTFVFTDGALTGYNNPAFKALLVATSNPFGLNWPTGEDKLFVLSVGTGHTDKSDPSLSPAKMNLIYSATVTPHALIAASAAEQDLLCRTFGKCIAGPSIDSEVGDMIGSQGPTDENLFTYARIDTHLNTEGMKQLGCDGIDPKQVARMDNVHALDDMVAIGEALAESMLSEELLAELI